MKKNKDLPEYLYYYFLQYLPLQLGASENTIKSYRDTFIIFLRYCNDILGIKSEKLYLSKINRHIIEEFLLWLESEKNYSASSRNQWLASVHAFFRYIQTQAPEYMSLCSQVLSVRSKKVPQKPVEYLTLEAIKELLATIDTTSKKGRRDLATIALLYDTGARVSELANLTVGNIRFRKPASITLTGKGNKSRIIPLMPQTMEILKMYMEDYNILCSDDQNFPLFFNKNKKKLSREGIAYILGKYVEVARVKSPDLFNLKVTPHVLRHCKAMILVQNNVNIIYIRDFLGHVSVSTTEIYAKANPELKRKAIEKASQGILPKNKYTKEETKSMLDWLKTII